MNHTPEPWTIKKLTDPEYPNDPGAILILGANGRDVCAITHLKTEDVQEDEANANLMKAAPALYYALQEALTFLGCKEYNPDGTCKYSPNEHGIGCWECSYKKLAQKALAQAEGK